jgi:hypothetical protein
MLSTPLSILLMSGLLLPVAQTSPTQPAPQVHVEIIVKACPPAEPPLEPTNQGKIYDNEKSMTHEEREAYLAGIGCIDVPIPPEVIAGNTEMTMAACRSHAGYLASMQYLEENATIPFKAVGEWVCIPHAFPADGVAGL